MTRLKNNIVILFRVIRRNLRKFTGKNESRFAPQIVKNKCHESGFADEGGLEFVDGL